MLQQEHTPGQCPGTKADGSPCPMRTMKGTDWCWNHQPGRELEREAARRKGGQHRRKRWRDADGAEVDVEMNREHEFEARLAALEARSTMGRIA
jgi:hypothetical protein